MTPNACLEIALTLPPQWRHYLGLISQIQSEPKKGKMQKQVEEEDDEEEEEDAAGPEDQTTVTMVDDVEARQRMEDERRPEPQQTELNDEALARRDRWREAREDKKEFFLNDPELAVKLFFSSHWRDKGYVQYAYMKLTHYCILTQISSSERKCEEGPILIAFFLRYLIRNRVFPEEEAKLKRAAALCDLAKIELPATSKVAQALPDEVSKGFEELNGQMTPGMFVIYEPQGDAEDESEPDASEEPDAKKRKIESESDALEKMCEDDPTVEVIDPNAIDHDSPAVHDAIRDNVDQNGDEFEPSARPASPPANTWDTGTWGIGGGDGVSTDWGSSAQAATSWGFDSKNALVEFLGPTMLPFTHTTGIVERSTRKIVQIIRPAGVPAQGTKKTKSLTPTEGVEDELARHFGVVVLAPWVKVGNHVASDIIPPQILPDSRGSVVLPQLSRSERLNYGLVNAPPAPPPPPDGADSPHAAFDPRRDAVRVLAAPATLDTLAPHVGMGVLATWVQIARKDAPADDVQARAPAWGTRKKKGGQSEGAPRPRGAPGKNGAPTQWWYMESTACALTSFHTDRYYADQDE